MAIVSKPAAVLSPRESLILNVSTMIMEAATSQDDVDPWVLADSILEHVEEKIVSVEGEDGPVTYEF